MKNASQENIEQLAIQKAEQICDIEDVINASNQSNHSLYKYFSREECINFLKHLFVEIIQRNKNTLTCENIEDLFSHTKCYVAKLRALLHIYKNHDKFKEEDWKVFSVVGKWRGTYLYTVVKSYMPKKRRTDLIIAKELFSAKELLELFNEKNHRHIKKFIQLNFPKGLTTDEIDDKLKKPGVSFIMEGYGIKNWGPEHIINANAYISAIAAYKNTDEPTLKDLIDNYKDNVINIKKRARDESDDNSIQEKNDQLNKKTFLPQYSSVYASSNSSSIPNSNINMPIINTSIAAPNVNPIMPIINTSVAAPNVNPIMFPTFNFSAQIPQSIIQYPTIRASVNLNANILLNSSINNVPFTSVGHIHYYSIINYRL